MKYIILFIIFKTRIINLLLGRIIHSLVDLLDKEDREWIYKVLINSI